MSRQSTTIESPDGQTPAPGSAAPATRRSNLLNILYGRKPQWVPCALNVAQWEQHHRHFNKLPQELSQTNDLVDVLKILGCDIFSRNLDGGYRESYEGVKIEHIIEPGSMGPRHIGQHHTPYGTLQNIAEEQTQFTTQYYVEDLVKDWDKDAKAYRWLLGRRRSSWDREAYEAIDKRVGDDGLVMIAVGPTPLKRLQIDMGLDHACLFILDHPDEAKELCELYWEQFWPTLQQIAAHDGTYVACLMDNVDTSFYPPAFCEHYWTPYVRQAAELFEARGKRIFVHACGQLTALKDVFRAAKVHGLEGMAHAPLGDFEPEDARDISDKFIYHGGFTAHEQVTKSDDEVRSFYDDFFQRLDGWPRFIFSSACQTAPQTPWERIKMVVEICRQHGGSPPN